MRSFGRWLNYGEDHSGGNLTRSTGVRISHTVETTSPDRVSPSRASVSLSATVMHDVAVLSVNNNMNASSQNPGGDFATTHDLSMVIVDESNVHERGSQFEVTQESDIWRPQFDTSPNMLTCSSNHFIVVSNALDLARGIISRVDRVRINARSACIRYKQMIGNIVKAITRRFGHKSVNQSAAISSLRSLYPISDHHYGIDFPRFASTLAPMGTGHLLRRGTGGRSSVSGIIATVFGATGFLGRYVVQQLAKMGSQVLVPFRGSEDSHRHLKVMGDLGQIVPMKYDPRDESSIKAVMAKANVVVNLIGRDYETRNYSFDQVNCHMAEQLAQISKEHGGIMRFIQVSCLGASPSAPSKMLRAKAAAEESIMRELPEATIMKPAVLVGTEDRILNRWAAFAKKYGFLPLIGDGSTKVQPVYVVDVAAAIVAALRDDGSSMGKVYELGGPDIYTIHELAELMHETIREYSRYVHVPVPIAKAIAMPRELLLNKVPFPLPTPEMVNLDTIDAITTNTVVSGNALTFNDLGIQPHKIKGYPIEFLIQYRKGGPNFGSTVSEKISPDAFP